MGLVSTGIGTELVLPQLLDTKGLCDELKVKRSVAEAIIRKVPKQEIPGCRRLLVRRDDVLAFLEHNRKEV